MTFGFTLDFQSVLQTLSVLHWIPLYVVLGAIPIILVPVLLFTNYWMLSVLTLGWLMYDWKTHSRGGRRSNWVRNWTLWKYFRDYFPVKLVKTCELSPSHNYIIAVHPHGILSYGVFCNFGTDSTGFSQLFPGITPSLATLEGIFWIPLVREYVMAKGICPVSHSAMKYLLTEMGSGNAVVVVVGGAAEALLSHPGSNNIILKNRKGFVRLAFHTGASLVPCYSFGENDAHKQEVFPESTWLGFFQNSFQRIAKCILGLNFCTFHGRGLTRDSWGFLPFNVPITAVVGEPLPIPKIENPSKEMVDKYHTLYIKALRKLFDEHKARYGISETQELEIL
ncbi:diacylglycerol O-acyltransferase 2-like protein 6 [Dromiciops gliroides]|uniref:diacylglycerol O-acyltransferase 2-like protein 6 n=1 Tax=Dromiciops gliroides TaxID=33562 RepID=UPI001CC6A3EA|nr:diacylglycerol O-acyltransferase 2-like protein 6 [Dromiciops gliroides]